MVKRLTYNYVKEEVEKIDGYKIISKTYKLSNSKIKIAHLECGNFFSMKWNNFQTGQRCPYCFGNMKLKIYDVKKIARKIGYIITSNKYINAISKINFKHLKCKRKFNMTWNNFQRGQRCPHCAHDIQSDYARLKLPNLKVIALSYGYKIISKEYKNNSSRLKFYHIYCKRKFEMMWNKFHSGQRCPHCAKEMTESQISSELKKYFELGDYDCILEYRILRNPETNRFLPYDIYLVDKNIFIEINGLQHYKQIFRYQKSQKDFEYQKKKDRMKRKYARKNGVYVEIDLRKIKTTKQAIDQIEKIINKK